MNSFAEGDIEEWLITTCTIPNGKAAEIAERLAAECWITSVNGLRVGIEGNPTLLDELNLPHNVVSTVKSFLIKRLKDLSNTEVKCVLQNMFPSEPEYVQRFEDFKISGIVLCFTSSTAKLVEWGISSSIHAEVLQNCLDIWKEAGVPSKMFREQENQKPITSSSQLSEQADTSLAPPAAAEDSVSTIELDIAETTIQADRARTSSRSSSASSLQSAAAILEVKDGCSPDRTTPRKRTSSSAGLDEQRRSPRRPPATVTPASSAPSSPPPPDAEPASSGSTGSSGSLYSPGKGKNKVQATDAQKKKTRGRPRTTGPLKSEPKLESKTEPKHDPDKDRVRTRKELTSATKQTPTEQKPPKTVAAPTSPQRPATPILAESKPANDKVHPSVNATVNLYLHQATSTSATEQTKGLHALHRLVTEDPSSVNSMRVVGAVDTLMKMLSEHSTQPESTLVGVLDVLNTIIALARDANVRYIIDKDLINLVLPLCSSSTVRVRLLALWTIGNAGTVYFKDKVVRPNVLNALAESYNSVLNFRGKDLSDIRDRYAETFKQLCSGSSSTQFFVLAKLIPAMVDVLSNEDRVEAISGACEALNHLIDANGVKAVDFFHTNGVIDVLIERLSAPRIMAVYNCLRALSFIVACSTEQQMQYVEPAVGHMERLMIPATAGHSGNTHGNSNRNSNNHSEGATVSPKVASQAALFVAMLCKGGERPLGVIMMRAPKLIPFLFDTLLPQTLFQVKQLKLNNKAQNAALALMYAAQRGNNAQLSTLLGLGVYTYAFRILLTFDDIPNLVVQTLKALRRIVVKVENIAELQRTEADFDAKRFWSRVEALKHTNKAGATKLNDMAGAAGTGAASDDSAVETENVSITDAKMRKYAVRLCEAAQSQGVLPA